MPYCKEQVSKVNGLHKHLAQYTKFKQQNVKKAKLDIHFDIFFENLGNIVLIYGGRPFSKKISDPQFIFLDHCTVEKYCMGYDGL